MNNLSVQAPQVELHQFIRIVNHASFSQQKLLFQPANSLAFPASQIKSFKREFGREVVELTCLSLYGVSSPLPHYFITDALNEENAALRAFLGIFNQLIYRAYFHAWEHKHPELFQSKALRAHEFICDLTSEGISAKEPIPGLGTLFVYQKRTSHGLKRLIEILYPGVPYEIQIQDCEWLPAHQASRLGVKNQPFRLGDNLTLGQRIPCAAHRIKIVLGPLRIHHRQDLKKVRWLKQYLKHALRIDLVWLFDSEDGVNVLSHQMQLGWTATLGPRTQPLIKVTHV